MKYNETIFLCYQWKHTKSGHALFSALSADYVKFPWPIRGKNENFPAWKLVDFIRRSTIYLQMSRLDTTTALLYVGFEKFFWKID